MIIIAPTKTMKQGGVEFDITTPCFLKNSNELRTKIMNLEKDELATLMKIKNKTLEKTYSYFHHEYNQINAINAYDGIAFKQIVAKNESYLKENIYILSALYGILKATDGVEPYRLDFTMKKIFDFNLYRYWEDLITDYINQKNPRYILNLASEEYAKMIRKNISCDTTIIDLDFLQKTSSTNLKKYRGQILNYCIDQEIYDYEELVGVELANFKIVSLQKNMLKIETI